MPSFVKIALIVFAMAGSMANANWFDPCNARYDGVWQWREGRQMYVTVQRTNNNGGVMETLQQRNGNETLYGRCNVRPNGNARIRFQGGINNGNLTVNQQGNIWGNVGGYGYQGRVF